MQLRTLLGILGAALLAVPAPAAATCTEYLDVDRPAQFESYLCVLDLADASEPPEYTRLHHELVDAFVWVADPYASYYVSSQAVLYQEHTSYCFDQPCTTYDETWGRVGLDAQTPLTPRVYGEAGGSQFQAGGPSQGMSQQAIVNVHVGDDWAWVFFHQQGTPGTGCSESLEVRSTRTPDQYRAGPCVVPLPFLPMLPPL